MAIDLSFTFETEHTITVTNSDPTYNPFIPSKNRLYVIDHFGATHPFYIGTATNVKSRFKDRTKVLRDFGLQSKQLEHVLIYIVHVTNGVNANPGDNGTIGGVDVEHLLIRTYVKLWNFNVRNIMKWGTFFNNTGQKLSWSFFNNLGQDIFGVRETSFFLKSGDSF